MDLEIVKMLGQTGVAGLALAALSFIAWQIGQRMVKAVDDVGRKLDEHTTTDRKAWADVDLKVESHFRTVSLGLERSNQEVLDQLPTIRQEVLNEVGVMRRDLAVLGTRIDTLIDTLSLVDRVHDEEHSRRTSIPPDRHERPPQSGVPVVIPRGRKKDQP